MKRVLTLIVFVLGLISLCACRQEVKDIAKVSFAWSTDGFHYHRSIPEDIEAPYPGTNVRLYLASIQQDIPLSTVDVIVAFVRYGDMLA